MSNLITLTIFFNLFSLFFSESCQITIWTIGYVIPYHVKKLYDEYSLGYGILSMQGKESKHSELKQELKAEQIVQNHVMKMVSGIKLCEIVMSEHSISYTISRLHQNTILIIYLE